MPVFIMLTRLTSNGVKTLKDNPSRVQEVNKEVEQLGVKVLSQWATLGEYDFVSVVEAPDEQDDGQGLRGARLSRHDQQRDACRRSPPRSSRSRCDRAGSGCARRPVRILVVGGGGREHAIVRALGRSDSRHELLCTPGNAGIAADARCLDVAGEDVPGVLAAAKGEGADLVVVGPGGAARGGPGGRPRGERDPRFRPARRRGEDRGLEGPRQGADGGVRRADGRARRGRLARRGASRSWPDVRTRSS